MISFPSEITAREEPAMANAVRFASAASLVLCGAAIAQSEPSLLYRNAENRFAVIFPAPPMARDVTFTTKEGTARPARQFYLERGNERYSVILVRLPEAAPVDKSFVDHAAEQIARKGRVKFRFSNCYDPGVPGAQLNLAESNGNQLRASVYMWDRQLYITETSAPEGSGAALQFEQSITILDPMGDDLNTGQGSPPC
jgi:hypothetical protein